MVRNLPGLEMINDLIFVYQITIYQLTNDGHIWLVYQLTSFLRGWFENPSDSEMHIIGSQHNLPTYLGHA